MQKTQTLLSIMPYRVTHDENSYGLAIYKNKDCWTVQYFRIMGGRPLYESTCESLEKAVYIVYEKLVDNGILKDGFCLCEHDFILDKDICTICNKPKRLNLKTIHDFVVKYVKKDEFDGFHNMKMMGKSKECVKSVFKEQFDNVFTLIRVESNNLNDENNSKTN